MKCDDTRAETRFRLSGKRTSPFKSAGASVQSTTGSRGVRISGSNAGYTTFRDSVKSTGYPLHSPVSPSLPLPCVTVCHHISTGLYTELSLRSKRLTLVLPGDLAGSINRNMQINMTSSRRLHKLATLQVCNISIATELVPAPLRHVFYFPWQYNAVNTNAASTFPPTLPISEGAHIL